MDAEKKRWHEARELFQVCLDLPAEERSAYLRDRCGSDLELRADVESLLSFHHDDQTLINLTRVGEPQDGETDFERYRLIEKIGQGGMGEVHRARRSDGAYEDEVAIKLLQRGVGGEDMVRRFWQERQILATLKHPAIARLLDGGTSSDGRPYLVMELVDGTPIDRYCDDQRAGLRRRIELFVEVCRAVHFAHQSLV
ncbi:MAG: protein kinase, partial [Acidobacteriota bacterium]